MTSRIAFIGGGNMGRALIGGLLKRGHPAADLIVADPVGEIVTALQRDFGITPAIDNQAAVATSDIVLLAVKPQQMRLAATTLAPALPQPRPLVISIAAGITTQSLTAWLGAGLPLVRAMPNTPALVGRSATGLFATPATSAASRAEAEALLKTIGYVVWVDDEAQLDGVTALSGSGPAYFFLFLECLERAAMQWGLPAATARALAIETAAGAAELARTSMFEPAELRRQVTSKGGTTEQALNVLMTGGFERLVTDAVAAAARRAGELSAEFGGC